MIRTKTSQSVDTINVHRTTTADTLSATSSECKSRIRLVLDSDECIEHHGSSLVQVESVRLHLGLGCRLIRVPSVDVERLDLGLLVRSWLLDGRGLALWDNRARGFASLSKARDGLDSRRHATAED